MWSHLHGRLLRRTGWSLQRSGSSNRTRTCGSTSYLRPCASVRCETPSADRTGRKNQLALHRHRHTEVSTGGKIRENENWFFNTVFDIDNVDSCCRGKCSSQAAQEVRFIMHHYLFGGRQWPTVKIVFSHIRRERPCIVHRLYDGCHPWGKTRRRLSYLELLFNRSRWSELASNSFQCDYRNEGQKEANHPSSLHLTIYLSCCRRQQPFRLFV